MKQLLYMPVSSYFFRGKTNTGIFKRYLYQCIRHFRAVAAFENTRQEVLTKPIFASKKQNTIFIDKRLSSYAPKSLILMDFDVWIYPKFSLLFKSLYNFFKLKEMDDSFSVAEFSKSSVTALQVVTTLLSELRFSELEGLLTQQCKEEVEKNLKYWPEDQISVLAVKPDKIIKICPCDIDVFSDEKKKKFVEIRIIHYVWMKYSSKFEKSDLFNSPPHKITFNNILEPENLGTMYMYGVFNSKFIREFTEGVADQWTINAINVKCYSDIILA